MHIQHQEEEKGGTFKIIKDSADAGFMTYVWAGDKKFIIDHTEVDPAFKGLGYGQKLVQAAVDFARIKGVKILPLCPFAKRIFEKDTTIKDVLF